VASVERADLVVSAIAGAAGLQPTRAALTAGKKVALANKESLVMGGRLIIELARTKAEPSFRLTASTQPFFSACRETVVRTWPP